MVKPEDKELIVKDLCARLPYGVICQGVCEIWDNDEEYYTYEFHKTIIVDGKLQGIQFNKASIDGNICNVETVKPYLRPMSSMTEEESAELSNIINEWFDKELFDLIEEPFLEYALEKINYSINPMLFDWLNKKMFDYRGLIPKDLAIPMEDFILIKK